jgi:hypothetical protein
MFLQLVNHNDDIRRLVDKGYALAFDGNNYLVVRDIPYLDAERKLHWGAFVSKFVDKGQNQIGLHNHEIFFAGSVPHRLDGTPVPQLSGGPTSLTLSEASKDVVVQRSFLSHTSGKIARCLVPCDIRSAPQCGRRNLLVRLRFPLLGQ